MLAKGPRIGFIFLTVFSGEGGIQSYVKDVLAAYLAQTDSPEADIFLLRDQPTDPNPWENEPRFKFYYFGHHQAAMGRLRLSLLLAQRLFQTKYSRIICGHILLSPLVNILCKFFQVPYTVMTYGKEVWSLVPSMQLRALQQANNIWTISRYSRDLACSKNGLSRDKFRMLPCIVNGEVFTPQAKDPTLLAKYGLQHARVLMTVARLWPGDRYKGVDITIQALPTILQQFPNVKYLVIGRGEDQPRLAGLAQSCGVSDRVIFAGFIPDEELIEHYRLADAYVMPSKEGFGIVYLEAMACGVPVLSGNDDGSADPLQDGRVGWRVPHRDSEAVAQACIEILKGDDPRCNGAWLREQALASFSFDCLQLKLTQVLASG